jgi:hypothetical protein
VVRQVHQGLGRSRPTNRATMPPAPKSLQDSYGNHWCVLAAGRYLASGRTGSLSVISPRVPGGLWGRLGHLVPVGLRYGRLSKTAWARTTRSAPPLPRGPSERWGRQGRLGREGPRWVRSGGPPCPGDAQATQGVRRGPKGLSRAANSEPDRPVWHVDNAGTLPNSISGLEPQGRLGRQRVNGAPRGRGTAGTTGRSANPMPVVNSVTD